MKVKYILINFVPWFSVFALVIILMNLPTNKHPLKMKRIYRSIGKKHILFFNSFNNSRNWNFNQDYLIEFGSNLLHEIPICGYENCIFTSNITYLNNITLFDAILFNVNQDYTDIKKYLNHRLPKQNYVFASHEPSFKSNRNFASENNFFNITMTNRLYSDVPWIDYHYYHRETDGYIQISQLIDWQKPQQTQEAQHKYLALTNYKTKYAFYKGGRCDATSERDKLVEELQKYIEIDNYSNCGIDNCRNSQKCQTHLLNYDKYKFYLVFEEELYPDYISNEFFMALNSTIVPVVFGGANYELFAPTSSYIDANNFNTVEHLANHLLYLDQTPYEYVKFFWWKDYYTLLRSGKPTLCDLCMVVNEMAYKVQMYNDIQKWWYIEPVKKKIKF